MGYLEKTLISIDKKVLDSAILPETLEDSDVDFSGDGVVIEGHVIAVTDDLQDFYFAGEDEDVWVIHTNDVLESRELSSPLKDVPGRPVKLKVKTNAIIRLERSMKVGKHIIGSTDMDDEPSEESLSAGPPKGCKCARRCRRGWCCAQNGWIYRCQRSSCVFTRSRC